MMLWPKNWSDNEIILLVREGGIQASNDGDVETRSMWRMKGIERIYYKGGWYSSKDSDVENR